MKITIYRSGLWFSGLCLDEVEIKTDHEMNIDDMYQQKYALEELGYEIEDECNNPFMEDKQFEYYNEYKDKVVVRIDYKDKTVLKILKQYNNIENCETTIEVITRLGALNKLHADIVKIFQKEYGVEQETEQPK